MAYTYSDKNQADLSAIRGTFKKERDCTMSWFYNVFLTSLFKRVGAGNEKWLTQKQTSICCQYMKPETIIYENKYGDSYRGLRYTATWSGREVILTYSKLNGCGTIYFGYNEAEKAELKVQADIEKKQRTIECIQRCYQKHHDRYMERIARIKRRIAYWEEDLQDCIENKEDTTDTLRCLKEAQEELKLWESV